MTAQSRARTEFGGAEEQTDMKKSNNGKHRTTTIAESHKRLEEAEKRGPTAPPDTERDEYDELERQDTTLDLAGWFSPREDKAPTTVKGEILQCVRRKRPTKNQTALFFVVRLGNDVPGLRFPEDNRDGEGYEDTMHASECVGIDMRQALERLENYRGPVKIVFVRKEEVEDRTWWRTEVYARNLPTESPRRVPSNADRDAADAEALDKAF